MLALRLRGIIARPNAGARVRVRVKNRSENENGNEHQEVKNEGRNAQKMEVPADFPPVEKFKLDPQGPVPTGEPGYLNGPAPVLSPKRQRPPIPTCSLRKVREYEGLKAQPTRLAIGESW